MSAEAWCEHTIVEDGGYEGPCDLPATDWRWYEDGGDGPLLAPTCVAHGNAAGREMARLRAEVERIWDDFKSLAEQVADTHKRARELSAILSGDPAKAAE